MVKKLVFWKKNLKKKKKKKIYKKKIKPPLNIKLKIEKKEKKGFF